MDGLRARLDRLAAASARRVRALGGAVFIVLAAGVTLLVLREESESPTEVLEKVQRAVAAERSVRFSLRGRVETDAEEGTSFVTRVVAKGAAAFPDRFRLVEETDDHVTEVIAVGDTYYVRAAEDKDGIGAERWGRFDLSEERSRLGVVAPPGDSANPFEQFGQPHDIQRMVEAARRPVIEHRFDDAEVLRCELRLEDAFVHGGEQVDEASLELTVGKDGGLERLLLRFSGEPGEGRLDYELSGWGERVGVEAPPPQEIDPTPETDEEGVANFKDAPLLQPRVLPEGWVQTSVNVLEADETEEGCRQVEVDYEDPDDPDSGYLYLFQLPRSCAELDPPRRSRPFKAGASAGWVADEDAEEGGVRAQLVVGDTVLQADTDLDPDVLTAVLSQLVPLDLAQPPHGQPGLGRQRPAV